ncbi:MAG: HAMP domain-containing histidine kinase [Planctomycetes bacterium]|nr:HAMP domain-containing histidine kinase [Planctomycetota bacterium]
MSRRRTTPRPAPRGGGPWLVFAAALAAALVPTACVLAFMTAAMRNAELAVRQRLAEAYRQRVGADREEIASFWSARAPLEAAGSQGAGAMAPPARFADLVGRGAAQSVIILDGEGRPAYPAPAAPADAEGAASSPFLDRARHAEFVLRQYGAAAEDYRRAAEDPACGQPSAQAAVRLARARCLHRAGQREEAMRILLEDLAAPSLAAARDGSGRSIPLDARMLALQWMGRDDSRRQPLALQLAGELNAYAAAPPAPAAPQRLLLMELLGAMGIEGVSFPMLEAERLGQEYLAYASAAAERGTVTPAGAPGLWQVASEDGRVVGVFREGRLIEELTAAAGLDEPLAGVATVLHPPGDRRAEVPFLTVPAGEPLPGWTLAVYLDEDPLAASAARAQTAYLIAGLSATAVIVALAGAAAAYLGRQIRLTRLKNDLIATVSHELKTPLASMRVLVDTLQEGRTRDAAQAGQYLGLIARENERLSRLIDNFLAFSRMERHKRVFTFEPSDLAGVVRTAVAAMGERPAAAEARVDVDLPADLPPVRGDRDALVTVVLNLLDNAWKYTGDRKEIAVRAAAEGGRVRLDVADNGIGLNRRAQRRVFDRFYQVDQTLARRQGGCGLGLAIVKFIVDAHGGTVSVRSQPGQGTTFTMRLPADGAPAEHQDHGGRDDSDH